MPNLPAGGWRWLAGVFVPLLSTTTMGAASAGGDPVDRSPVAAQAAVNVYSPAMDRFVPVRVLRPADTSVPRPGFESVVNGRTVRLAAALPTAGVPARIAVRPTGTHAWGYRQDALHDSWPMFAAATGA